jgi:hypothetical protein
MLAILVGIGSANSAKAEALGADLGFFGSYLDSDDLQEAIGGGAKLKFNLAEFFALDVRGSYLEFDDTDITVIPVEALALLQLPLGDTLNLYGGVGVGYYFFDADNVDLEDSVGYFPVAGLEVALGEVKLFGEIRWLALSPDADAAGDELDEIFDSGEADADGIGINVGIALDL